MSKRPLERIIDETVQDAIQEIVMPTDIEGAFVVAQICTNITDQLQLALSIEGYEIKEVEI